MLTKINLDRSTAVQNSGGEQNGIIYRTQRRGRVERMVGGGKIVSCMSFREIASGKNASTDGAVGVDCSDKAFVRFMERKVQNLGGMAGIQGKVA